MGLYCSSGAALAFAWRDYMPTFTDASLVAAGSGMLLWAVLATQASHRRRTWAGLAAFAAIEIATFVRYTNIVILGCAVVAVIVAWRLRATDPALWRRLELASDLFLDQVHDIIQVAFGWTDSHLHRFASGSDLFGAQADHFLCPFDVDEGDTGIPEGHVRLDEVVAEPGDQLFYSYDYGDDWQHVIVLEAVLPPRAQGSGLAVCTDGRRRGPAEDCGGAHIYELVEAATGRGNARAADAADELAEIFGDDIDIEALVGTDYSPDEINGALDLDWGGARCPAASVRPRPLDLSVLPPPIYDLLGAVRTSPERRMLRRLIDCADLAAPVFVEAVVAAAMVRPYSWLLDRVGDAGIKLTAAGYLPPADVEAAVSELGLGKEWFGKGNRESQTLPVLDLREAAQRAGLLRKYSGRLQLSPRGRAARSDPVALWWRLAESLPDVKDDRERQAGLLLLLMLAAGETADWADMTAGLLTTIGWRTGYGESTTSSCAFHAAWSTHSVLRRVGALDSETLSYQADEPSREGIVFARAALLTWRPTAVVTEFWKPSRSSDLAGAHPANDAANGNRAKQADERTAAVADAESVRSLRPQRQDPLNNSDRLILLAHIGGRSAVGAPKMGQSPDGPTASTGYRYRHDLDGRENVVPRCEEHRLCLALGNEPSCGYTKTNRGWTNRV